MIKTMRVNQHSWTIPGNADYVDESVLDLIDKIKYLGFNEEEEYSIRLSLSEAIINGIQHGNSNDEKKTVLLELKCDDDKLTFSVTDQGKGFDFKNTSNPTDPNNLIKEHGRGIFLMKNYMDEMYYEAGGRRVVLVKYIKKD